MKRFHFAKPSRKSRQTSQSEDDHSGKSMSSTLLLLYGFLHTLMGLVFTLADALSSKFKVSSIDHKYYLEIFLLLDYFFCILGIVILHCLVLKYEKSDKQLFKKKNVSESTDKDSYTGTSGDMKLGPMHSDPTDTIQSGASSIFDNYSGPESPRSENGEEEEEEGTAHILLASTSLAEKFTQPPHTSPWSPTSSEYLGEGIDLAGDISVPNSAASADPPLPVSNASSKSKSKSKKLRWFKKRSAGRWKFGQGFTNKLWYKLSKKNDLKIFRDKEGVNLYLRLGAVAFGFGVMIHDGFKISDHLSGQTADCRSLLWVPKYATHFAYIFMQTFFVFKFHRIVFNCHRTLARLIIIHLTTTNICQWVKTIVYEISEEFRRKQGLRDSWYNQSAYQNSDLLDAYSSSSGNNSSSSMEIIQPFSDSFNNNSMDSYVNSAHGEYVGGPHCVGFADSLSPFIFPCAIEYSLVSGAICYKLFQKVGSSVITMATLNPSQVPIHSITPNAVRRCSVISLSNMTDTSRQTENAMGDKKNKVFSECHKSHRGLFVGLLVVMATMVSLGLFFFLKEGQPNSKRMAMTIYYITEITLLTLSGFACLVAFHSIHKLKFRNLTEGEAFDDNLLLIGLSGMIAYNIFLLLPSIHVWSHEGRFDAKMYAMKSALEILQTLLQVLFIMEASHRCARNEADIKTKPGRTWVTFLLVCNLAMWIVNTFEVKRADHYNNLHRDFYKELPWNIVTFVSLPLIIFFRFHSTVCLSDIWSRCYKIY